MRIFISGATGYIGKKIMKKALAMGHEVNALVRVRPLNFYSKLHYFTGDITDPSQVLKAMEGCDQAFHAAAFTRMYDKDRSLFYRTNVEGTRNVLQAAHMMGVKKLVFTSSGAVLGPSGKFPVQENDPRLTPFENDYEISKFCAEQLVKEYVEKGLDAVIVRPTRVYGPGIENNSNAVTALIRRMLERKMAFLPYQTGLIANYAFIDDVVDGHFQAMEKGYGGNDFNIGGENISYADLFSAVKQASGENIKLVPVPRLGFTIASFFVQIASALTGRNTHFTPRIVKRFYQHRAVSCQKAVTDLGYSITPFREGIKQTIDYIKLKRHA
jgi:nucleoside-diphosphate-sugar epimerase